MDVTLQFNPTIAAWLAVAALAGTAVGIEREWSGHTVGPHARFAGVRTFLLVGLQGGLAGWFIRGGLVGLGLAVIGAAAALIVAAYVVVARQGGDAVDGTTEMAALAVLSLGVVAGLGFPLVTSAIVSVMVLALVEKSRIHSAIRRLGEKELTAALQFAVLALVVLPLLPTGPFGPFDSIRPRALWIVVLLFSALNFVGYIASRTLGTGRGYILSGLAGGVVSSTAVTLQFARRSREEAKAGNALALGVVGACTILIPRVLILTAVLNTQVTLALIPFVAPAFVVGGALVAASFVRHGHSASGNPPEEPRNPLRLWSSLRMALAFQVVLTGVAFIQARTGTQGVLISAAALGLTDVDALTYAMCRLATGQDLVALAARGLALGILSNTVVKAVISVVVGRGVFRRYAGPGLILLVMATGLALWIVN